MKLYLSFVFVFLLSAVSAQSVITYPYNPDSDDDAYVATGDLLETLSVFGSPFTPNEILISDTPLEEFLLSLQAQVGLLADQSLAISDLEYMVFVLTATIEAQDMEILNLQYQVDNIEMMAMTASMDAMMAESTAMMAEDMAMTAEMTAMTASSDAMMAQDMAMNAEMTAMMAESTAYMASSDAMMANSTAMMAEDMAMDNLMRIVSIEDFLNLMFEY